LSVSGFAARCSELLPPVRAAATRRYHVVCRLALSRSALICAVLSSALFVQADASWLFCDFSFCQFVSVLLTCLFVYRSLWSVVVMIAFTFSSSFFLSFSLLCSFLFFFFSCFFCALSLPPSLSYPALLFSTFKLPRVPERSPVDAAEAASYVQRRTGSSSSAFSRSRPFAADVCPADEAAAQGPRGCAAPSAAASCSVRLRDQAA